MKTPYLPIALCLFGSLLGAAPVGAAAPDLFAGSAWGLLNPKGAADLKTVPASGANAILSVTVHHPIAAYYQIQLTHDVAAGLPAGTSLRYHFWARSATKNPIHAVVEKRTAPYTRVLDKAITLTPTWKEYSFVAAVPVAYSPRGLAARLQVGQQAGTVEFKSVTMTKVAR